MDANQVCRCGHKAKDHNALGCMDCACKIPYMDFSNNPGRPAKPVKKPK